MSRKALAAALALASGPQLVMRASSLGKIHPVTSVSLKPADAALVLGARVWEDGRPSRFLRERVEAAAVLYHSGVVPQLLLSGAADNREGLDETATMRTVALDQGVSDEDILVDGHGVDTAASARRAHREFGLASVIAVSQEFHLPRAVWLCTRAGLDAQGAHPPVLLRRHTAIGYGRELAASWKAIAGDTA